MTLDAESTYEGARLFFGMGVDFPILGLLIEGSHADAATKEAFTKLNVTYYSIEEENH